MRHQKLRYHLVGIKKVVELFEEEARKVTQQHIISDLKEEGWSEKDHFPCRRGGLCEDGAVLMDYKPGLLQVSK